MHSEYNLNTNHEGHANFIVSSPSGPRPGNRAPLPQKKNSPRKTNRRGRKKSTACSPRSVSASGQKKQMPPEEEIFRKGQISLPPDSAAPAGSFILSGQPSHQGSAQESVPPYLRKNRPRKTNPRETEKQVCVCLSVPASDGKRTIKLACP